jgi:outer membrane protein assembly factor BamB
VAFNAWVAWALVRRLPLLTVLATLCLAAQAAAGGPRWTTYRHDAGRSGVDPDSTNPVTPSQAWQTSALDGQVYGQPLVYGSNVFVATENDTIYSLDAATGSVVWSTHLATPEPASSAPCGDISPSIGITGTPVIDPASNRIYAVGAVSSSGSIHHELFALDLASGQQAAGFPIAVDPTFPSGGAPRNQLQRPGLALDDGRILIGYGGNDGDCSTYWGWVVSAPESGAGGLSSFQADPNNSEGAVWAAGNAPAIDASGNVFIATGNGTSSNLTNPDFGDAVVKLNSAGSVLDWWAPTNWHSLDSSDADLGSSMPTLLPGGYLFESGKDGKGYVLNGANLGHVSSAAFSASCGGGSFGGSVYDAANSTIYATCGGLKALSLASGSPPTFTAQPGFSATSAAKGPPTIAGGLVWATNYSSGSLYGVDPSSGVTRAQFTIPESGADVNHFASPSAGGGRLFVASGYQVTAFIIAQAPVLSHLGVSPHRVHIGQHRRFRAKVTYTLSVAATVKLTIKHPVRDRSGHRRWVRLRGSITLAGRAGANTFKFHGRIGGRRLRRGSYELIATPGAGGLSGSASAAKFLVVS